MKIGPEGLPFLFFAKLRPKGVLGTTSGLSAGLGVSCSFFESSSSMALASWFSSILWLGFFNGICIQMVAKKYVGVIKIRGSVIEINRGIHLIIRKIVSPEWIKLYLKVKSGDWDQSLWDRLSKIERDLMGKAVALTGLDFPDDLNVALATDFKSDFERLKLLEGNIQSGNSNPVLLEECIEILSRLKESGQLAPHLAGQLIKKMRNTIKYRCPSAPASAT
jgi:hypothetical protein